MARHPGIRVLLAVLVAFWSPAWCCCRVLEAAEAAPGHADHHDAVTRVGGHDAESSCSGECEDDCAPHGDHHRGDGCGCQSHDRQAELTASVQLPPLQLSGVLDAFVAALPPAAADLDALATNHRLRTEAATAAGRVRALTLHAQGCLLLI